jgi:GNAT superfamily N-acetyltransferase
MGRERLDNRLTIRRAVAGDADTVVRLARAFHQEDSHPLSPAGVAALLQMLKPGFGEGEVFLAAFDGEICGYGILCYGYSIEYAGRDAFLDDVYILPAFRSRGFGAALVEVLEERARAAGCGALHLEVMSGNRAEKWYRRLGYGNRGSKLLTKPL